MKSPQWPPMNNTLRYKCFTIGSLVLGGLFILGFGLLSAQSWQQSINPIHTIHTIPPMHKALPHAKPVNPKIKAQIKLPQARQIVTQLFFGITSTANHQDANALGLMFVNASNNKSFQSLDQMAKTAAENKSIKATTYKPTKIKMVSDDEIQFQLNVITSYFHGLPNTVTPMKYIMKAKLSSDPKQNGLIIDTHQLKSSLVSKLSY